MLPRTPPRRAALLLASLLAATGPAAAQGLVPDGDHRHAGTQVQVQQVQQVQVAPASPRVPGKLSVGDPAPPLPALEWLRGEPITAFAPGTTYVLEFWAPWCPWCREALPQYADIARRYGRRQVQVLGLSVWPRKTSPDMAREFVAEVGDELFNYPVAQDVGGALAKSWLEAADLLIPTAIVVDASGRIAWMGDPRKGLEKELVRLLGPPMDSFEDLVVWRTATENELAAARAAAKAGQWQALAEATRKLYEKNPAKGAEYAVEHYLALVMAGQPEAAQAWGRRLMEQDFAQSASGLNVLAWRIVDPAAKLPLERRDLDLALDAALRASKLTEDKDAWILDTVARTRFLRGELAEALRLQIRAVDRSQYKKGWEAPALREELRARLAEYQAAAEAAESAP